MLSDISNILHNLVIYINIILTQTILNFITSLSNTFALIHEFGLGIINYLRSNKYDFIANFICTVTKIIIIMLSNPVSCIYIIFIIILFVSISERSQTQSDTSTLEHTRIY
jgi:hypothetical protein